MKVEDLFCVCLAFYHYVLTLKDQKSTYKFFTLGGCISAVLGPVYMEVGGPRWVR